MMSRLISMVHRPRTKYLLNAALLAELHWHRNSIATLEQILAVRSLGVLDTDDQDALRLAIGQIIG